MKKTLAILAIAAALFFTAFLTYRVTMRGLVIEIDDGGRSAYVTVYGRTDVYDIGGVQND
jgi:hypothetical protein